MAVIGVILALVALAYAGRWVAKSVTHMPHTPAPVRRAAQSTADAIGNPRKAIKKGRVVATESVETIWAKARADDWRERQQIRRAAAAAKPPRQRGRPLQRFTSPQGVPGVNGAPGQNGTTPTPTATTPPATTQPRRTPPPPPANGRTAPVTTPTPTSTTSSNGAGTGGMAVGADMLTAVQHLITHVQSGGILAKQRGYTVLSEGFVYMGDQLTRLAHRLAEPDQDYPPAAYEPLLTMAAHLRAAANVGGEGASVISSIRAMTVGELAGSSVKAPHHDELNKA